MQICEKSNGNVTVSIVQVVQDHSRPWNSLTADVLEALGCFQWAYLESTKSWTMKYRGQLFHIQDDLLGFPINIFY